MEGFEKYHKIKRAGDAENRDILTDDSDEIVVQEKVDGANLRIFITDGQLIFGSRNQQLSSDDGEDSNVSKNFIKCLEYIRERTNGIDLSEYNGLILYGECMVKHTLQYNWDIIPPFLGFDIKDVGTGLYQELPFCEKIFSELNLEMVPLIGRFECKELKEVLLKNEPL